MSRTCESSDPYTKYKSLWIILENDDTFKPQRGKKATMSGFSTLVQWVCTHKSPVENAICTKTTRRIAVCHLRPSHLVAFKHILES